MPRYYNKARINDRTIDEMIGLCKGIVSDSVVNQKEADFLCEWMNVNVPCCDDPMVNQIYRRIHEMMIDGVLDKEEQEELLLMLRKFTGTESVITNIENISTSLPLDDPQPLMKIENKIFCLTGTFAYGPRKICSDVILSAGGKIDRNVTLKTDYLVTGFFTTSEWIHSTYGRKIEKAMEYRDSYGKPSIVSEDHWASHIFV